MQPLLQAACQFTKNGRILPFPFIPAQDLPLSVRHDVGISTKFYDRAIFVAPRPTLA